MDSVRIIGAGLAGCEAALQLAEAGITVELYDVKPQQMLAAYQLPTYCELVCNNSFGSSSPDSPLGLLLYELDLLGSKILEIAKECLVADTTTISVDKLEFSSMVTTAILQQKIKVKKGYIDKVPQRKSPVIFATGPLTGKPLASSISKQFSLPQYTFADASSPVIAGASIQFNNPHVHKISKDLYAIEIPEEDFSLFFHTLTTAQHNPSHHVDYCTEFVQCQALEKLAHKGKNEVISARFSRQGFSSPVLTIRRETGLRDAYILVGCICGLGHKSQINAFSKIPGLQAVKFIRYGRQHRNTFFQTPGVLDSFFKVKNDVRDIFIIGQLSGLDGYAPAIASGLVAAQRIIGGVSCPVLPKDTMIGALANYVSDTSIVDYQPMCASFSLLPYSDSSVAKQQSEKLLGEYLKCTNGGKN